MLILAAAIGGYRAANEFGWPGTDINKNFAIIVYMILGSAIGYVGGGVMGRRLARAFAWAEDTLQKMPLTDLVMGLLGLIVGLLVSFLVTLPLAQIKIVELRLAVIAFVYLALASLGIRLCMSRRDELLSALRWRHMDEHRAGPIEDKLLDTNIIIDGRIVEIMEAGFLEGRFLLPRFVLKELHKISDSADPLKRERGRRGSDQDTERSRNECLLRCVLRTREDRSGGLAGQATIAGQSLKCRPVSLDGLCLGLGTHRPGRLGDGEKVGSGIDQGPTRTRGDDAFARSRSTSTVRSVGKERDCCAQTGVKRRRRTGSPCRSRRAEGNRSIRN